MIARLHYDRQALTHFLDEAPTTNDSDIAVHLEQCHECQAKLESLFDEGLTMEVAGELLRDHAAEDLTWEPASSDWSAELNRSTFLEPSQHPGSLGRFARFEIMELLGRGGMGIVMRGFDTSLNRHSAVKVLAPELATSAAARKRFSREAKSAAAVVHPHVVPIQTVDEHDGLPYLVMPVVEGQSVDARVRDSGPLSVIEAVRIASQIAEGLAAAHGQGLVHRDIKPANVLLENGVERVQITDFGLARAIDDASMTRSGVIAGTPQYMSPEQAHGDSIDHRSDLFSLGSLIYFMLTGHSPFRAETTMGVLNRIGNEQPRSLRSINADIPEWFEQIVMKLLAKPREDRFQTASEVADLLQRWHAHLQQPDVADPPRIVDRKLPLKTNAAGSRGGWTNWLIAAAAFGFLAFAGVLIVLELEKGTLTIESEVDDVPIRIMQGDKIVERLTVTKTGTSVRVASGKYVVLIEGEFNNIHVDSDTVTLGHREKKTVRIVQSEELDETIASGARELSSKAINGVLTPKQVLAHGQQLSQYKDAPVHVRFRVGSVRQQMTDAESALSWYLCPSDEPSELGLGFLKVWISPAAEAALKEQGITDFEAHFAGKTVSVSGQVRASAVTLYSQPTSWVYSMELDTRDQLTVLEAPSKDLGGKRFKTPNLLAALRGRWREMDQEEGENFNQTFIFFGGASGQWIQTAQTLPVGLTYYVEGTELILQFNHELEGAFGDRLKQLRFDFKLVGDLLLLTRDGVTTRLHRLLEPSPAKTPNPIESNPGYAPELGKPQTSQTFTGGNGQPTRVTTLAGFVRHFNHTIGVADLDASPQPPLTVEELRCFALWTIQTDKQLSVEAKGVLTDIGIGGWLPKHWKINGRESQISTPDGEIGVYVIELASRYSDTKIVVRQRFVSVPANFQGPRRPDPIETATPLDAAITEFNAIHHEVDGLRQPPLNLEEVLAAILDWKTRRNEAPVDNKTFANFQEIALTHQLPAGANFEVIPNFQTAAGDTFKIWSVRIRMPQAAKPGSTMAFTIRDQYVSVNSDLRSAIHWGKPNDRGLQAGFRLIPGQRAYQAGQSIETEFLYRSTSGKPISATMPNVFSYRKMIARDAIGKSLDVVQIPTEMVVGGAIQTQITETPTRKRGKPLQLGYITPDPRYDSLSPHETYLTVKDVEKVFLSYIVSDLNGGELRTGELVIDIAETLAEPRF